MEAKEQIYAVKKLHKCTEIIPKEIVFVGTYDECIEYVKKNQWRIGESLSDNPFPLFYYLSDTFFIFIASSNEVDEYYMNKEKWLIKMEQIIYAIKKIGVGIQSSPMDGLETIFVGILRECTCYADKNNWVYKNSIGNLLYYYSCYEDTFVIYVATLEEANEYHMNKEAEKSKKCTCAVSTMIDCKDCQTKPCLSDEEIHKILHRCPLGIHCDDCVTMPYCETNEDGTETIPAKKCRVTCLVCGEIDCTCYLTG